MAKVKLEIQFDNKEWKPISIETTLPDKFAYVVYRKVLPKRKDFVESIEEKAIV